MVAALVQWPSPIDLVLNLMLILILYLIVLDALLSFYSGRRLPR